jgi:hypothetical protein
LTTLSLHRLPVSFRPYHDETMTSWLSRASAVYGCTFRELLATYNIFRPEFFEDLDYLLNPLGSVVIQALVGGPMEQLQACTLATAYPHWLPRWISRPAPLWHVNEHRTVAVTAGLRPSVCLFCLTEDLEDNRSQYLRLSWLSSITTICPIHFTPLVRCCSAYSPNSLAHGNDWSQNGRMRCTACRSSFESCHRPAESQSLFAVARLECLLRAALAGNRVVNLGDRYLSGQSLLLFVEDATWALMQPVVGTQYRVLHTLQTTEFRVPMGFNTPVSADYWLSCGPLEIRRSILAVLASLILDTQICSTLMSHCGRGRTFWKAMKLLHCSEDRQAFKYRAASWSPDLIDTVDFY